MINNAIMNLDLTNLWHYHWNDDQLDQHNDAEHYDEQQLDEHYDDQLDQHDADHLDQHHDEQQLGHHHDDQLDHDQPVKFESRVKDVNDSIPWQA